MEVGHRIHSIAARNRSFPAVRTGDGFPAPAHRKLEPNPHRCSGAHPGNLCVRALPFPQPQSRLLRLRLRLHLFLPLLLFPFFFLPNAAAQTATPSLEISVTELSADGGTIQLTTKNSAFIGADIADIVHRNATYRGYFDINGAPTSTFRNKIFLAGGPAGMEVSSITMFPPTQNTNGVGANNHHVLVEATFSASTSPLASDVPVTLTVHRELILFLNSDGTMSGPLLNTEQPGWINLTAPLTITPGATDAPLEFAEVPIRLSEDGAAATYRTALRQDPGNGKTVTVTISPTDTGAVTVSPKTLTFTGGNMGSWQTPRRITVAPVVDADGADEALYIEHSLSGLGSVTNGGSVRATVADGNGVGVLVSRRNLTYYSNHGRGTERSYDLRLATPPSSPVNITVASGNSSRVSIAKIDGQTPGSVSPVLTFNQDNWNRPRTVTLALGNSFQGSTVTISHTVATQGGTEYDGVSAPSVTVAYRSAGAATDPIVFIDPRLSIAESGSGRYTLALRNDPGSGRTVTVDASVDREPQTLPGATVSPTRFTFTGGSNGTWSTPQTATVTPAGDNDADDETVTISHAISGLPNVTNGGEVTVSIRDNVSAGLVFDPTFVTVPRDGTTRYSVRLKTRPVAVRSTPGLHLFEERYTEVGVEARISEVKKVRFANGRGSRKLTFNSNNWNQPQFLEVVHSGGVGAATIFHTTSTDYFELIDGEFVNLHDEAYSNLSFQVTARVQETVATSTDPRATLSVTPAAVSEGGNVTATVNLVGGSAPGSAKIIPLLYTNGSAADADYTPVGTVRVLANQRSASATVAIADDSLSEDAETFTIALGELPFGIRRPGSGESGSQEITIDASDQPTIGIAADAGHINEGGTADFTITASNAAQADITVDMTVNREGAYVDARDAGNKSVTLPAGSTSVAYSVATSELASDDPNGQVSVTLRNSSSYAIDADAAAGETEIRDTDATTVAIGADAASIPEAAGDAAITLTLGRGLVNGESLSLPLTIGGSATRDTDYTIAQPRTLPAGVTYDAGNATPTVTFTGPGSGATADSATLLLTAVQDALDEGAGETVSFALPTLNANSGAGLDGGVSGSGSASVTIDDDDDQPEVSIQGPAAALTEGDSATFTINVAGAAQQDLDISFTTSQVGSFASASDAVQRTETLSSGRTSLTHTVATIADSTDERSGSLTVTLNAGAGYGIASGAGAATVAVTDDDATGVRLSAPGSAINEAGGSKTLTITIDRGLVTGETLALPLRMGGAATLGTDYGLREPSSRPRGVTYANLGSTDPINDPPTVTFTGGATPSATTATVVLRATGDNLDEGDSESVTVNLPALDGASGTGLDAGAAGSGSVSFNINDDDAEPVIRLARNGSGAIDEGEQASFTITANNPADRNLTIALNVTDTGDFLPASAEGAHNIVLEAGETSLSYTLATATDVVDERSGSVAIALAAGSGYTLHGSQNASTVTVNDDDATRVTLSVPGGSISESGGAKTLTLTLPRGLVGTESLPVRLRFAGSAAFGADYTLAAPSPRPAGVTYSNLASSNPASNPPTVTFGGQSGGGATTATLILRASSDALIEEAESVSVALAPLNASSGSNLHGGARGTGNGGFSITDANGTPTVSVSAGAAQVEGMDATFTVRSTARSTRSLLVNLSVGQTGSFVAAGDRGGSKSVVIPAGETQAVYKVPTVSDSTDEADGSVTLTVTNGTGYSVSSGARNASVNITDDDSTTVTLAATDTTATEGDSGETGEFTVTLGRALVAGESLAVPVGFTEVHSSEYSLTLASASGIGLNGNDLTFTGGSGAARMATITFGALNDQDTISETPLISIPRSSASGAPRMRASGLGGGAVGSGTAIIVITDTGGRTKGVTIRPGTALSLAEGGQKSYSLLLDADPGDSATVVITPASDNTDVTFSPAGLTFTGGDAGNWSTPQRITLEAAEDADAANDTATISHRITGYTGVTSVSNVTVTVTDAGTGFIVEPQSFTVVAGNSANYQIRLKSQPAGNVVLDLTSSDTSLATVQTPVTIAPSAWQSGATVAVTGVAAGDVAISHAHASTTDSGYASAALPGNVAATVLAAALPQISVTAGSASVTEGTAASFTITSDTTAPTGGFPVSFTVEDPGSFVSGALPYSVTIPEGLPTATVTIPTTNDSGAAGDELDSGITLTLQPDGAYGIGSGNSATVAIDDDDPTSVTLQASQLNVQETGGIGAWQVVLGRALVAGEALSVPISLSGTAGLGTDYRVVFTFRAVGVSAQGLDTATPTIVFTGGPGMSNRADLQLRAISDLEDDDDEAVTIRIGTLDSTSGTGLSGGAEATGTTAVTFNLIDDDGDAQPVIGIASDGNVTEGAGAGFTVTSDSMAPAGGLTVHLNVGQMGDYVAAGNLGMKRVTINAGDSSATYSVATVADSADEPAGMVTVAVDPGDDYQVSGSSASAAATVSDNDNTTLTLSAPTGNIAEASGSKVIKVALGRPLASGETLTQPLTFGGTATFGTDYTLTAPGTLPAGVRFQNLNSSNPSVNRPRVLFTGGAGASKVATLTLTATQDSIVENSGETVTVGRGTASQTGLGGVNGSGSVASFTITDDDQDAAPPELSIQAGSNVTEGTSGAFTITSTRAAPSGGIRVSLTVSQQGDFAASSAVGSGKSVTIPSGQLSVIHNVPTTADDDDEAKGSLTVALASGDGYTVSPSAGVASLEVEDADATEVVLSAPTGDIPETGGSKRITLTLPRALVGGEVLAVPITVSGDVAAGDYTLNAPASPPAGLTYALSGNSPRITFNGTNGAPRKATFTVSAVGDFDDEGQRESIAVGLGMPTSSGSGLAGGTSRSGSASFHITDDDGTPVIGIEGGNRVIEGGRAVFTLSASPAPQQDLTVNLNVEDDATADFIAAGNQGGKSVRIPANASTATYEVQTVNDTGVDEPRGEVRVTVASGTAYTASSTAGAATVAVTDNDPTTVTLSTPDAVATEGNAGDKASIRLALPRALVSGESLKAALSFSGGTIDTEFSLSEPASRPAGVSYDLTASPPTVAFTGGPGAAGAATVEVAALADTDETDASITVSLGTITAIGLDGGAGGARSGNGQIRLADIGAEPAVDIDMTTLSLSEGDEGSYRVKLHADPGATVTVTPSSSDVARLPAPDALTFTGGSGGNWSQWQTVTVESLPDADLANDNVRITHAVSGYGAITEGPEVDVSIVDAGVGISVDPATLSLNEGANASYNIRLLSRPSANVTVTPASGDAMTATVGAAVTFAPSEWNTAKTVQVNGVDTGMTRITHAAASTDSAYAALTPAPVDVTVTATARVRTSAARITAIEHGPAETYDVWLNTDPGGTVTVTPGTASNAIALSGALTFTSGDYGMKQRVTVTATPDLNATSESATITHAVSGYSGVSQGPQVAVAVKDAGSDIIVSTGSLEVREGSSVTYELTATTQLQGSAIVLISGQGNRVTVNPTQVEFNTGGSRTQTVTVQGASAGFTALSHSVAATDPSYRDVSIPDVGVLVTPQHGVIVNPTALLVEEGGTATYNVRLASNPNAAVTVTPVSRDTGAARVSGALTFNSSTWGTNQQVTVTGVQDPNNQHESVVIAHQVAGYSQVSSAPDLALRVEDDEARPFVGVEPLSTAPDPVEGQPGRFQIRPSSEILSGLAVQYAVSATGGYVAGSELVTKTVTIPADPERVDIDVPTLADNIDKASGSVTVTIVAGAGYQVFQPAAATRPVHDNDRGSATLSVPSGNINETGGSKTLTITLNRALEANENLSLRLAFGGDAVSGTDFALAAPGHPPAGVGYALDGDEPTVTFRGPSAAAATVILTATDDSRDEGSGESVSVKLAAVRASDNNLGGGVTVSGAGAFSILDDDEQMLPEVTIAPTSNNAVTEGGNASFTLTLDPAPEAAIEVNVTVTDAANSDFLAAGDQGARKIPVDANATSKVFTVPTEADSDDEASGPIRARVTNGDDYEPGTANAAEVRITDNDASRVTLATPDANAMEGDPNDTASISLTLNRGLANGEALTVPLGFAGGAPATDFTLACPNSLPTGVSCAGLGGASPSISFTGPGAGLTATSVTLTLSVIEDTDTDHERVTVSIPASTGGNPGLTATGLDGGVSGVRTGNGEIVLTDKDTPPQPTVNLSVSDSGAVTEGGNLTLTAEVSEAPSGGRLSIPVQRVAADSTADSDDYTLAANITVANGATSGTATLTARTDNDDELAETLKLQLGAPPEGYVNGENSAVDVTITDDTATAVTLTTPDTQATEGDGTDTAEIRLAIGRGMVNSERLVVPLQFSGAALGTDFSLALSGTPTGVSLDPASGEVTFAGPSESATEASILLTAAVDNNADDATVTVSIPARSTGSAPILRATNLDGGATGSRSGNGRITLKDAGLNVRTIGWASATLDATETASAGSVNVQLTSAGTSAVTFRVCLTDGTATFGSDYAGVITAGDRCTGAGGNADFTIAAGDTTQAVNFASIADATDEPDETYTAVISLPTPVAGLGISPDTLNVTIGDDDPTTVSLARSGSGAINEGGKVEFTVSLDRALVAGETIDAPLPVGGAGVGTGDWSLTRKPGASNTGITLHDTNTATPTVRFSGAGAQTATLELTAEADGTSEGAGETYAIALGTDQQFDADPDTNVGGGADPHGSNNRFTVLVNDPRTIGWAATTLSVNESDAQQTTGSVNAGLSTGNGPITFRVCLTDGGADRGSDYRGFNGNACTGAGGSNPDLEIASGQSNQAVTFTVIGDTTDEPDETFSAEISLPTAVTGLSVDASTARVTATIVDNDPTVVSLARVGSGAIYEAGKAEFTVTLGRALIAGEIIDVPLAVSGNGITTGDWSLATKAGASNTGVTLHDAATATPRLRFSGAGARVATLELMATVDGVTESGGETLTFALGPDGAGSNGFDRGSLGTNVGGGADPHASNNSVSLTVNDGRTIGWAATAVTVNESAGAVNLNAELSEGTGPVTFRVCLNDGSATLGEDFTGVSRASARCTGSGGGNADPTISSSASSRRVSPGIDQRVLDEPRETFEATLSLPNPIAGLAVDSANATATVTIVDKDPTLVTLSAPEGNIAEAGGIKRMTLSLGRALVSPEALTVPLSFGGVAVRGSEYTVACENAAGVQCAGLNSGNARVTFTGGANAARSVNLTITAMEDNVDEGPESVTVSLGTLNAGSGANLDGGASGSGSVSFDVAEEATIGFSSASFEASEGDGDFYATVQLSEPVEGRVTATVGLEFHGTTDFRDFRGTGPFTVRIPAGETAGRAGPVTLLQDTESEGDETLFFRLTKASNSATGQPVTIDRAEAVLTVRDDDPAVAGLSLSRRELDLTEGGAPGSYTAVLTKAPDADVTLTATSADANAVRIHTGQGTPAGSLTLVFSPQNWNQARTIVVTAQQDADHHDERPFIKNSLSGTGDYQRVLQQAVSVNLTDDDDPPAEPVVSISGGNGITEGGTARFTLRASPRPQNPIDVSVNVDDSGDFAIAGQTGTKTFTISTGGSVTFEVTTDDDSQVESDGTITATLAGGNGYTVDFQSDRASVAVSDNDEPPPPPPPPPPDTPIVSITGSGAITEGGTATFNLSASPAPASTITVNIDVADSGDFADSGQAGRRQATIGANGRGTLSVRTDDDNTDESHGSLTATVATGQGYSPSGTQGTASIAVNDNDDPPPVVSITGGDTINEGGNARFTLTASPPPRNSIRVSVTVSQTGDFAAGGHIRTRTVTVGSGGTASFTVATTDDSQDEPHGAINATVNDGTGYDVDSQNGSASVTVRDNDEPLSRISISRDDASVGEGQLVGFTISAAPAPTADLDVRLEISQTGDFAEAGQTGAKTVTILANTASESHFVVTVNDEADEKDGSITARILSHSRYRVAPPPGNRATTAVTDDDVPTPAVSLTSDHPARETAFEGAALKFTLHTDVAPETDLDVTVDVSQPGNAFVNASQTGNRTVTVRANTRRKSFTVQTHDDSVEENPSHATVTATVQSGAGYTVADSPKHEATVDVHDNDGLPTADILDIETEEGQELVTAVELSKPVPYRVEVCYRPETGTHQGRQWGTAVHPSDFIYGDQCLTIRPGRTRVEGWIETVDDNHDEGDEWFTLVLWLAEGAVIGRSEAIATIRNSDPLPDAWLARFGRAVSEQAVEGITARIEAVRTPARASGLTGNFAGQPIAGNPAGQPDDGETPHSLQTPAQVSPGPASAVQEWSVDSALFTAAPGGGAPVAARGAGGMPAYGSPTPYRGSSSDAMLRQLLMGSHFTYSSGENATGGTLGAWGRGAVSNFSGTDDALQIDGDLASATLGADYVRGKWVFGLALTRSLADGGYSSPEGGYGTLESTLTAAIPYAAWEASERFSLWGAAGHGGGRMTLNPGARRDRHYPRASAFALPPGPPNPAAQGEQLQGERLQADIGWSMAALGARSELFGRFGGGPKLTLISDALWARTTSDRSEGLLAGAADISRLRLGVEGSWAFRLGGMDITPKLETGLRHDGGDAETGFGIEVGGGIAWTIPRWGLKLDLEGRTLMTHEEGEMTDRGFSAALAYDPRPDSEYGLSLALRQDIGGQATGGLDALFANDPITRRTGGQGMGRWSAEAGYGLPVFGERFVGTPHLKYGASPGARDIGIGWRLKPGKENGAGDLSLAVLATRRESLMGPADHGLGIEIRARW